MTDPIVDRIDAFVRKRRSFVASSAEAAETAAAPSLEEDLEADDVPLLTDIVDLAEVSGEAPVTTPQPPLQPRLDALAADLSQAVADRLAADLPELLHGALERLHADLRQGIAGSVDAGARDFLARRQQLRLPFPDDSAS